MAIDRVFIDWSQPALPAVVKDLLAPCQGTRRFDLSDLIVVFPGRQAARRFLELLVEELDGRACPPRTVTMGDLPELLYVPQRPFASLLTQRMAWAQALRELPQEMLEAIVRRPPAAEDADGWLKLGDLLARQHSELARDQLDFNDVARRGRSLEGFDEIERWSILSDVQQHYLKLLDGFQLWDQQTARLVAIKNRECRTDRRIVLVGTVDLNRTLRSMLQQVADKVTVYVHAPPDWGSRFDEFGCLIPEAWSDVEVEIRSEQVHVVDDAPAQAEEVVRILDEFRGKYALEDATIAVPDEDLIPVLTRTLDQYEVPTFWPVDRPLEKSRLFRLLSAAADYLETRRPDHFAALIRHPDVHGWLSRQKLGKNWLTDWDEYVSGHLPSRLPERLERSGDRDPHNGFVTSSAAATLRAVDRLLERLKADVLPLSSWARSIERFLTTVYDAARFDPDDLDDWRHLEACRMLHEAFAEHCTLPGSFDQPMTGPQAIRLTLEPLQAERLYRTAAGPAVQLAGWLEAPLDDAPAVVVTSFNEGLIPSSVNHDLFLPNRLRAHLGIEDNARRYARDLHTLLVLLHSRQILHLVVARRNSRGDALAPSRLLFATRPEEIARRVLVFYNDRPAARPIVAARLSNATKPKSDFQIPRPVVDQPLAVLRVTAFRDYLASPYRFYLRHVMKLQEISDDREELDPASFGELIHDVLREFGRSEIRHSTDEVEISRVLDWLLDDLAHQRFGDDPLAAVGVQIEQTRLRLRVFARWQAGWRRQGWEIHRVEETVESPLVLPDGRRVQVRGRIDRIDYSPATREWAIFDYKTGEAGDGPNKAHRSSDGQWQDFQLPLYRLLARANGIDGPLLLGYIVLPRDVNALAAQFADWSEDELQEAEDEARNIAALILSGEFWKELSQPPGTMTEFNAICQTGVFGAETVV